MKKIIINTIFVLTTFNLFCQTTFSEDSVEFYFLEMLNVTLRDLYPEKVNDTLFHNKNASLACIHHNEYMRDTKHLTKGDELYYVSHGELLIDKEFKYVGNDTLITSFYERIRYFNINNDFSPRAEVISSGFIDWFKFYKKTNKDIAKDLFINLMRSPEHKRILTFKNYNSVALDVLITDVQVMITAVVGDKK